MITPGQNIAVLEGSTVSSFAWRLAKWGFPLETTNGTKKTTKLVFNARSETIATKTLFHRAFYHHRCLVPASGFFEWQQSPSPKQKTPYWIHFKERQVVWMAGILLQSDDKGTKANPLYTLPQLVIVTQPASQKFSWIHERFPLILSESQSCTWMAGPHLDKESTDKRGLSVHDWMSLFGIQTEQGSDEHMEAVALSPKRGTNLELFSHPVGGPK